MKNNSMNANLITEGWISIDESKPPIIEDGESDIVLCVGWKGTRPEETITYELMKWIKLDKSDLLDHNGKPIEYGWSNRWWNTNPDLYDVHFWKPKERWG